MTIDDCDVIALADTGAEFSVISGNLGKELKKVLTLWSGPHIDTAGGHLIAPKGLCTAKVAIRGCTYVGDSIMLQEFSGDAILGASANERRHL